VACFEQVSAKPGENDSAAVGSGNAERITSPAITHEGLAVDGQSRRRELDEQKAFMRRRAQERKDVGHYLLLLPLLPVLLPAQYCCCSCCYSTDDKFY
jgi:hypothetical protein